MPMYKVTLVDGQQFRMTCNMVEASAGIRVNFHDPDTDSDWQPLPYQTADAGHGVTRAAELAAQYCRASRDDCTEVETVEEIEGNTP